jgi:MFS family permease
VSSLDDPRPSAPPPTESGADALTAPPEGVLGPAYRAVTLGIISCVVLIAFEATAVNTAMPAAAAHLHGLSLYAFAFSGFFTTSLFAMVVSGQWCDRQGPLVPLFTGIGAFAAGLVIAGTARNMWTFVGGRSVQGVGGGLVIVALYVVVGRFYPERLRPAVMAAFSASWVVPAIVGPLVSGAVTENLGWRWVFLSIPVFILLPVAVMFPTLRRLYPDAEPAESVDWRRIGLALAVATGAGLLQYAGQERSWVAVAPAVVGAGLLVPAILRLLPRGTLRAARGLPAVILLRGVAAGSFISAESFVPLMLVTQRGFSTTLAGLSLTGGGVTWALGSFIQSHPRAERHRHALTRFGTLLVACAIAGVALALLKSVPAWTVAAAWGVGGVGMGLAISSCSVLLLKLSPPEETGHNSASLQVSDALGNVLLVAACGVVFSSLGGGSVVVDGAASAAGAGHAGAFAGVFLSMTGVALLGTVAVATRLRPKA